MQRLPKAEREKILAKLTPRQREIFPYIWTNFARDTQVEPEPHDCPGGKNWLLWMILSGRGWGKTRTGVEFLINNIMFGGYRYVGLAGRNAEDVREIIIEGESGIMAKSPPYFKPRYRSTTRTLEWPNGAKALIFYGTEGDSPRGKQFDLIYADELASWQYPDDTFSNMLLGLRLGKRPKGVVTTTPRPIPLIKELVKREDVHLTKGSTYDNRDNLSGVFYDTVIRMYEGTRRGRQEIYAEILDDNPNALWKRGWIESSRVTEHPDLKTIVVALDPEASSDEETSAETGIVAAGISKDRHIYVLADDTTQDTPKGWATQGIATYNKLRADRIIGERNNGGEMIEHTLRTVNKTIPYSSVWASRGKQARAEPISALYEQGLVHHVGSFSELEDQMCDWEPGSPSPDRMDALVWAASWLMERYRTIPIITAKLPMAG